MLVAKTKPCYIFIAVLALFAFFSCNDRVSEVPFPYPDSTLPRPQTLPLALDTLKKFEWQTVKADGVKPVVRKLDLATLPTTPYKPIGFEPFPRPIEVAPFNINSLPDTVFNIGKIAVKPLGFKVSTLSDPQITKSGMLIAKPGSIISLADVAIPQGLPEKQILALLRDKNGFMWMASEKSLYKYDGENMYTYNSLPIGIESLMEDRRGRIWFVTRDLIGMLDIVSGTVSLSHNVFAPFPNLPRMTLDENGQIWIPSAQHENTIVIVDPETLTYRVLDKSVGISGNFVRGVYRDEKKNLWITTNDGADIITSDGKLRYLRKTAGLVNDTLRGITGDGNGKIWISTKHGDISEINLNSNTIKTYRNPIQYGNLNFVSLIVDEKDVLWMGTGDGLRAIDTRNGTTKRFAEDDAVTTDFVLDLYKDEKQRIWMSTYFAGVSIIESGGRITHPVGTRQLSSIMEGPEGKLWLGSGNNVDGIQILDEKNRKIAQITTARGLGDNFIQNFAQTDDGKILVCTNGGFDIIDLNAKTVAHTGRKEGLSADQVYGVLRDGKKDIWLTGPSLGVDKITAVNGMLLHAGIEQGLSENNVVDIKADKEGRVWLATSTKGVDIIDPEKGTIRNLHQGPGLKDTCNRVLMPDSAGNMWIGTDKGVYVVDKSLASLTIITTAEGLCNDYVTSLINFKGQVFVGTKNKVSIITAPSSIPTPGTNTAAEWKVQLLAGSEGLTNNTNSWSTNVITRAGKYVWADAGITFIDTLQPQQPSAAPTYFTGLTVMNNLQVFRNEFSLGDKDTVWTADTFFVKGQNIPQLRSAQQKSFHWDSVSGAYNMPINLRIPYNQNYLQFHFAQMHLGRLDTATYTYIVEGIDKKWSLPSNRTSTDNYLNLPPGKYVAKVRSKDISGQWGAPASFSFTILPPWWQTWWMYVIYALALVGAIIGYNKYRSTALLKENRVLEERVAARTLEVKQQADELSTINQISLALVSQADLDDLIKLVGNQLRDLFKADIVYIALLDKKTRIISFPFQYGDNMAPLKLGEGLTSKIILSGQPLLINKDVQEQYSTMGINRVGIPAASYLGVPIPVSNEIIGVLSIQSTHKENHFAEKDKNLLSTIAANVGVAIRKARLYEEVKLANTDADAARKAAEDANAAKSAFLSTVSHELRTPLTSVLGFAKITKKRLEEKIFPITDKSDPKTVKTIEQISGNLNVVISEGERLTNLINDVLDLAKIEAGKMEWSEEAVNMNEVVERAIAATSSLFEQKNLALDRKMESELPQISGDRDKLIQVVVNLLSNAVKFTKEGRVTCSVYQKDGSIVVGITDTGIGIAPEDHDKVFEQFKQVGDTLTDKPKGTGLGLPICKEIVEHHGGKIWLESEFGHGSTFYFMLPVMKMEGDGIKHIHLNDLLGQLKKRVAESHPSIKDHNATILVVDDDEGIRSLLKQELTEAGYIIEEATNGKEAVAKIRSIRPDLVILDVMMPEMNGFDVAAILKNDPLTMEIPIIILSIVQDKSRGFRIGVDRYLTKPIDTNLLFSEIGNLLEQGKSRKKVMVVDEDNVTVRTLTDVLEAKGYQVVESDGKELVEKAIANQPDIIILNSVISDKHEIVKTLRFEKGLENVLFLIYQ